MATDLVDTPRGPARVQADDPDGPPRGLLVLGHGAGGGITAPDLVAVTDTAVRLGLAVRRVEQPYRVAGRRSPAPAGHLDEAWRAVLAALAPGLPGVPLVVGGRSAGARVACRTAAATGARKDRRGGAGRRPRAAPRPGHGPRCGDRLAGRAGGYRRVGCVVPFRL